MNDLKFSKVKTDEPTPSTKGASTNRSYKYHALVAVATYAASIVGITAGTYLVQYLTGNIRGVDWGRALLLAAGPTFLATYRSIYKK